jgi:signal transduction histidine kinase
MTHLNGLAMATALLLSHTALAQEFGTFEEARELLNRATAEVRADKQRAFDKFNHNDPRYRDRDLFVFCFDVIEGRFVAHEAMVSHNVRDLRDYRGKPYGESMLAAAEENRVAEVTYLAPFPGTTSHVPKHAFVRRIDDYVCGVSAYLYNGPGGPNQYIGSSPH